MGLVMFFWSFPISLRRTVVPSPQNSFKPSQDLWEATLYRRIISVRLLVRSFSTDKQTSCYFIISIYLFVGDIAEDILDTDLILRSFGISDAYTQAPNFNQVTEYLSMVMSRLIKYTNEFSDHGKKLEYRISSYFHTHSSFSPISSSCWAYFLNIRGNLKHLPN